LDQRNSPELEFKFPGIVFKKFPKIDQKKFFGNVLQPWPNSCKCVNPENTQQTKHRFSTRLA